MTPSTTSQNNSGFSMRLAQSIVQARFVILALFVVLLGVAAFFVQQFRIDASAETLLVKNNALYIKTQQANQRFSPDEFILVAYKPRNGELFTDTTFADLTALSEQYSKLERVQSVTSMLNVPLIADASALTTDVDVSALTWQKQQYSAAQMQQLLSDHPIFTDLLLNTAQTAAAIQIVFKPNAKLTALESDMLAIERHTLQRELSAEDKQH
jgi:predicted RND superfamily exporter protein